MKKKFHPLSIWCVLMVTLGFSACNGALFPFNTTVKLQSERLASTSLTEKRVLIVSYDSYLTREFVISLKNYVRDEFKNHDVTAERINIRESDRKADIADFNKLKNEFKPDYLLTINVRDERFRKLYIVGSSVKTLKGVTVDFDLIPYDSGKTGQPAWKSTAVVNHFYESERITTVKKMAAQLGMSMQKDLIINILQK
jgi:hypothetical protein